MFLSNETDIFRELLPNTTDFFQENFTRQYFFLSQMLTYPKSLLTGKSANSTFKTMFGYTDEMFIVFVMITNICLSQISLTNQTWTLLRTNTYQAFLCHAQYCCM